MRSAILPALTAVLSVLMAGTGAAEIPWESSIRAAHAKAAAEGKLLLIHFERDNCVYCDKLKAGAFKAPEVGDAIAENFVPLKVNVSKDDRSRELGRMFQINRFPMDVVVTLDGQPLVHGVSPQDPSRYVSMLTKAIPQATDSKTQIAANAPRTAAVTAKPTANETAQAGETIPVSSPSPAPASEASPTTPAVAANQQQWALPSDTTPSHQLAAARTNTTASVAVPLEAPAESVASQPQATSATTEEPQLAMDGFCAVAVVDNEEWVRGKPEFGVVHLGKLYLFGSSEAMETFLANPIPYTPILNEIDVVRFFEERRVVPGKREWALQDPIHRRMFFFADEAAMNHFAKDFERYVDASIAVMNKAIEESNPGT